MRLIPVVAAFLAAALSITAADFRQGLYRGRLVTFQNVDGLAIYHGDIILGSTDEVESAAASAASKSKESSTVPSSRFLWPDGIVPFTIDPALPSTTQNAIQQAVDHWNSNTPLRLIARSNEQNYVRFTTSTSTIACSSSVGMVGGQQSIRLPTGCSVGTIIHEIGHAIGLWHEQERNDRNRFITVLYENIDKPNWSQFDQVFSDGADAGPFDFYSIMHYGAYDFSRDGLAPAMETVPAGMPLGQRNGLSAIDIDAIQRLYGTPPTRTTLATAPRGLKLLVDGVLVDDGTSFDWAPGSSHTIEAPFQGDDQSRYLFGAWSDGGAWTHTITASRDKTVFVANFIVQRKVVSAVNPARSGSVTIEPETSDGFYTDRSYVFIRATPAAGFNFLTWSVTPSRSLNPKFAVVRAPMTVLATFTTTPVTTITSNPIGRLISADGNLYSTPVNFAWAAGQVHTLGIDSEQPDFIHYTFTGWNDSASRTRTITTNGQPATYNANFVTQYSLSLTSSSRSSSIVATPSSPDGFYDEGTQVQLTAVGVGNSVLLNWGGDLSGASTPATITIDGQKAVTARFGAPAQRPAIVALNSASSYLDENYALPTVSPGAVVTIYGSNLGPDGLVKAQVSGGRLATQVAGTRVLFDGIAAPIVYASGNQVSAVAPYEIAGQSLTTIQVQYNGQTTPAANFIVLPATPGIFTADSSGRGGGAILNSNGQLNTPTNPAPRGAIVALWATGEGLLTPQPATGAVNDVSVLPKPRLPVSVRIGGQSAVIHYAGAAPFIVAGVMQLNVQIPEGIEPGPKSRSRSRSATT